MSQGSTLTMCIKPCKENTKKRCRLSGPARLYSAGRNILNYFSVNMIPKLLSTVIIFMPQKSFKPTNHIAASLHCQVL